MLVITADEMLQ